MHVVANAGALARVNAVKILPLGIALAALLVSACTHHASSAIPKHLAEPQPAPPVAHEPPAPARHRVAITIDDLGASHASSDPALSEAMIASLRRYDAPAAIFANCQNLKSETLLMWKAAGATIGNHTKSHLSIDDGDGPGAPEAWRSGVASCHQQLTQILGEPDHYFRFPYLRYGKTDERRREAAAELASLGYRVAHVTAATSEWLIADFYDAARANDDTQLAHDVVVRYVAHMVEALDTAERMSKEKLGRDIPQITLLHVNRLAADHLGDVLRALRDRDWEFIPLAEAMADPVYSRADAYTGKNGYSWIAHVVPPKPGEKYAFKDYEDQLRKEFGPRLAKLRQPWTI
jgi:peptidoglycan/xylan/chitin deacetylase (PgdA/CDA1 family)